MKNHEARDVGIEWLRATLMFGICLLHSATMCGHPNKWIQGLLTPCVNAFVFISGYYGIRFRPSKIIRLYGIGIFCAFAVVGVTRLKFGAEVAGTGVYWFDSFRLFKQSFWFLHAYVVLSLLAPLVDSVIESFRLDGNMRKMLAAIIPVLLLVYAWGAAVSMPGFALVAPNSAGVCSYSGLALLGTYILARFYRLFDIGRSLSWKKLVAIFPLLTILSCVCSIFEYATIVAVLMAMCYFWMFARFKICVGVGILTPSLFSVYLLHSQAFGFVWMRHIEESLLDIGVPMLLAYFMTAASVFVACLVLDITRRVILRLFCRPIQRSCAWMDGKYEQFLELLTKKLSQVYE